MSNSNKSRVIAVVRRAFLLIVFSLALFAPAASPSSANDHLKIATYNTHLVPPLLRCAEQLNVPELVAGGAITFLAGAWVGVAVLVLPQSLDLIHCLTLGDDVAFEEALFIADEVLKRDYDVIAFNEVFDEDARQRLIDMLSPAFPHSINYINSGADAEDSGLMFFSKFPFADLQNQGALFQDGTVHGSTDQVAFVEFDFDECDGWDCLASKGAAFVRIRNTRPNAQYRTYDFVFTHLQAAYDSDDENADTRKDQFAAIQSLIKDATNDSQSGPLFILGDLNIEGEGAEWNEVAAAAVAGSDEWKKFADNANNDPQVVDAWAATSSLRDIGITNHQGDLGDMRLDYVLANSVDGSLCVQHMTRAYLGNSDHIALIADTNRRGHFCNPRRAWDKPPFDTYLRNPDPASQYDMTEIRVPGAMQWFHVVLPEEESGAAIGVTNPYDPGTNTGVAIELFAPHNLTTPILPTSTESFFFNEVWTKKYVLPREFFIRAFSPNPTWTGEYDPMIHLLKCTSREEACPVLVNNPRRYGNLFVAGTALGPDDTAWFEARVTDRADSGKEQSLRFFADDFSDNQLKLELVDGNDPNVPVSLNGESVSTTANEHVISGTALGPMPVYMKVRRSSLSVGSGVRIGWESNLTRIGGPNIGAPGARSVNLVCDDETDGLLGSEAGSDEISLWIRVDHQPFKQVVYHEFDCNNGHVSFIIDNALGVIRFVEETVFTLYEEDTDTIFNPHDESQWNIQKPLPVDSFRPSQEVAIGETDIRVKNSTDFARWDFEGGRYHLEYSLSHQMP